MSATIFVVWFKGLISLLVWQEGVTHRDVSLDGDGQGGVDGPHEPNVSQRQHVGQHVDAVVKKIKIRFDLFEVEVRLRPLKPYLNQSTKQRPVSFSL